MKDCCQFYIDGLWVDPAEVRNFTVINPATEEPISTISLGSGADVDRAVAAAKRAFESYSETSRDERLALLRRVLDVYQAKMDQMAETISREMGAPISLSRKAQAPAGLGHLAEIVKVLEHFPFEELKGSTLMRKEPIGVCGLITPWNWPMNQIVTKVAPALAAGCTMVHPAASAGRVHHGADSIRERIAHFGGLGRQPGRCYDLSHLGSWNQHAGRRVAGLAGAEAFLHALWDCF